MQEDIQRNMNIKPGCSNLTREEASWSVARGSQEQCCRCCLCDKDSCQLDGTFLLSKKRLIGC